MSKSVGNVVDPMEVLAKRGLAAFRYYFLRHVDSFADSDFSWEKFENAYNNELANDLGNLVQRLATLASKNNIGWTGSAAELAAEPHYHELMRNFEFSKAFDYAWEKLQNINKKIDEAKPWSMAKNGETEKLQNAMQELIGDLLAVNVLLEPFLPETSAKIREIFETEKILPPAEPLFPKDTK